MGLVPLSLFVTHDGRSARQGITCRYKCGDACSHPEPNTSGGEYFGDLLSRRGTFRAGAALALAVGVGGAAACSNEPQNTAQAGTLFRAVAPNKKDAVVIPEGYVQQVVIRWGDPVLPGAPAFEVHNQSAAAQAAQFGFNNDFTGFVPIAGVADRLLMVVNHEYTTEPMMLRGYDPVAPSEEHVRIGQVAHGMSVVEVAESANSGALTLVLGRFNRRITASTPFRVTGPAAGSGLLATTADPSGTTVLGTLSNCSGGVTPWGTVLSGEENFHQYFANASAAASERRYGLTAGPSERRWERYDRRFDLAVEPHEANRFGYVVELDPTDPTSTPVKHSALGRFKHESANVYCTPDGTVVAYSGDDERFEYIYKFVSAKKIVPGDTRHNMTILAEGTLFVAKLSGNVPASQVDGRGILPPGKKEFDGAGEWLALLRTGPDGRGESLVAGMSAEEVAVFTRLAADKVGATKMDRPEDAQPDPHTGKVYVALTNNSRRGAAGLHAADAANPRNDNKNGQVLEITDDHTGTRFTWDLLLVCGDPAAADTYYGGFDKTQVSPISCPDNVAFDDHGNLWLSTDGNALKSNDGLFSVTLDGPRRGETKQFLTVPIGAETCGPTITDKRITVAVQHPGEKDGATVDTRLSSWPDGGDAIPRPAIVAVWKTTGTIGS